MKLLAIDTSTEVASVAVLLDEAIFCTELESQKTQAQLLLPMIDKLMIDTGIQMNQLDGIIFGCGPGSFTGLRIACSIAKGLAYAHDLNLIPVSSLAAIAWSAREQIKDSTVPVLAVLDARMQEMYWGHYEPGVHLAADHVSKAQEIQFSAEQSLVLAGTGIETYWADFPEKIKSLVQTRLELFPNASAMIRLSQQAPIQAVSVARAQPVYVRNQVTQGDSRG